jgi:hypothetical protein
MQVPRGGPLTYARESTSPTRLDVPAVPVAVRGISEIPVKLPRARMRCGEQTRSPSAPLLAQIGNTAVLLHGASCRGLVNYRSVTRAGRRFIESTIALGEWSRSLAK